MEISYGEFLLSKEKLKRKRRQIKRWKISNVRSKFDKWFHWYYLICFSSANAIKKEKNIKESKFREEFQEKVSLKEISSISFEVILLINVNNDYFNYLLRNEEKG